MAVYKPYTATMNETAAERAMLRERSEFGEDRSLGETRSRSMAPGAAYYHDEPEADYDMGATGLYRCIEGKLCNKEWIMRKVMRLSIK